MYYLLKDKKHKGTYETLDEAWIALLKKQPQSTQYATTYGGWEIVEVTSDNAWVGDE